MFSLHLSVKYSSSVFVVQLLHDRIYRHMARPVSVWNSYPGALSIMPEFSDTILDFPFSYREAVASPINLFTAVVYAKTPITNLRTPPLFRLLVTVAKSAFIHKVSCVRQREYCQSGKGNIVCQVEGILSVLVMTNAAGDVCFCQLAFPLQCSLCFGWDFWSWFKFCLFLMMNTL